MITKNDFLKLNDDEAVDYVTDNYCMDDINNSCEDYVLEMCDYDEDEYEDVMEEYQPFGYVIEIMEGDELKNYLWNNILEVCEEIDQDAPEVDTDCIE